LNYEGKTPSVNISNGAYDARHATTKARGALRSSVC